MTSPVRAPRPTPRRAPLPSERPARRDHLRVVPPPGRPAPRRRTGAVLVVAAGLVFGSLLAAAVFHGLLASGQAQLDQLDQQLQDERSSLAKEKLELANLQSPQRIATEAEAMGMHPADRQHWVSAANGDVTVIDRTPTEPDDGATDPTVEPSTDPAVPADEVTSDLAATPDADGGTE